MGSGDTENALFNTSTNPGQSISSRPTRAYIPVLAGTWVKKMTLRLQSKDFFVHDIGHFADVAAVISFEDVDESLDAATSHALVGIGREPGDATRAGKVRHKAAAVFDGGIAQRRIFGQRLFLVDIKSGTRNPVLPQCSGKRS